MALLGTEVLLVTGVAQNSQLSGVSEQTTTAAIAALAGSSSLSPTFNNLAITGLFTESASPNLTATGSNQAGSLLLTAEVNYFTTVAASTGTQLPAAAQGLTVLVVNQGANPLQVYGNAASGDIIDNIATATGVTQMQGSTTLYVCDVSGPSGSWTSNGIGEGYTGSLLTTNYQAGITAAGTNQATATQLKNQLAFVSTVASGTGVNLPGPVVSTTSQSAGLQVSIVNNGVNSLLVYPPQGATSDTINGQVSTAGVSIFPGTVANFTSASNGVWSVEAATTKSAISNTVASAATLVLTAAQVTGGACDVALTITGSTAVTTLTTPTATAILTALHSPVVGTSYKLKIINVFTTATSSLTGGSGVTVSSAGSGVVTIPASGWREFVVTVTAVATPAVTMVSTSTGTWS